MRSPSQETPRSGTASPRAATSPLAELQPTLSVLSLLPGHCRLQTQVLLSHHGYGHSYGSRGWVRGAQGGPGSTTTAGETEACMGQPPSNEFDQEKLLNSGSSSALRAVLNENKLLEAEHHAVAIWRAWLPVPTASCCFGAAWLRFSHRSVGETPRIDARGAAPTS